MVTALQSPITMESLRARREEILAIAKKHKASKVRVFGSVVTGDATAESDVDFLVTFSAGASLFDLVGLTHDLSDMLESEVDVADEDGLRPRYRERILAEAVTL